MRIFQFKLTAILMLIATPHALAQNQPTDFFAAPRDTASALIVATDPARVCSGATFVHPETGVIATGTGTAGSSCLGYQPIMKPTCAADGQKDCVIANDGKFSAVGKTSLQSGSIRRGLTIGGVQGSYPSAGAPLDPGSAPSALDTSGVTEAKPKNFVLFGTDGTPYQFKVGKISDGDFTPTKTPSSFSSTTSTTSPTMLYMPFKISGAPNLSAENIIAPNTILSITGSSLPRSYFKPEAGITLTTVNNSQNIAIAKAIVFVDTPTQARWMLLKDTTTAAPLSRTSSNATTLCSGAKVTINNNSYNSQTGVWALPSSKQVAWMLKTGATAPDGLIAKENLFSVSSKFWVYDPPATGTTGTYKTAYFTDILSDPVIEPAGTNDTANVVCVFKLASAGGGSSGNAPPNPTNLAATTPAANSVALAWVSGGGTTAGYRVSYLAGQTAPSTCSTGTQVSSGSISGTNASITGLSASTIYSFRVCAIDGSSTPLVSSGITVTVTTSGGGGSGTGTGSGTGPSGASGTGGGMAFTSKTGTVPVTFQTTLPDGTRASLAAHLYLTSDGNRAFAYVFSPGSTAGVANYGLTSANSTVSTVCTNLGTTLSLMQTNPLGNFSYPWLPVSKKVVDDFAAGFTVAPFLGNISDGKYPLGQNFLAFDDTVSGSGQFKVYQFSTAVGGATEASTAMGGAVICTAGQ